MKVTLRGVTFEVPDDAIIETSCVTFYHDKGKAEGWATFRSDAKGAHNKGCIVFNWQFAGCRIEEFRLVPTTSDGEIWGEAAEKLEAWVALFREWSKFSLSAK